ncbi:MAG: M14 family metallocarboxypeptidase [Candidatus Aenigmarchaeota archaeon]|nr:M14 family metallocarboxypeptidase [Candidatus Aenigmarchaeota archaeon]
MSLSERKRSYERAVVSRLKNLGHGELELLGNLSFGSASSSHLSYPFYRLILGNPYEKGKRNVLISAGAHGNEPAGVYAALQFAERHAERYLDAFNFFVYPCLNPSGFEFDEIKNRDAININRDFKSSPRSAEAQFVAQSLEQSGAEYAFTVDMHEDNLNQPVKGFTRRSNIRTFYLYETCADGGRRLGEKIVNEIKKHTPVCRRRKIYTASSKNGVIRYRSGKSRGNKGTLEGYLALKYTRLALTIETPTCWQIRKRVSTHLRAFMAALDIAKERQW